MQRYVLLLRVICFSTIVANGILLLNRPATSSAARGAEPLDSAVEQDRLSKEFETLWSQRQVAAARDVVARMLVLFAQRMVSPDREDFRTTKAWKHQLDVLCELDDAPRKQFFDSYDRIIELYVSNLNSTVEPKVEQELYRLVELMPPTLDFGCPARLEVAESVASFKCFTGDFIGAKPVLVQFKEGNATVYGKQSECYAGACEMLGGCVLELNDLDEAEKNFKECQSIVIKLFGTGSISALRAEGNLAIIDVKRKRYEEAAQTLSSLIAKTEGREQAYLTFANCQYQLGVVRMETNQWNAAEAAFQVAIACYRTRYPLDHRKVVGAVMKLAATYERSGNLEKARQLREEFRTASLPETRK